MDKKTIYTIGHSTHDLDAFLELLDMFNIEVVVDVRSMPGSRKFPQYNKENLALSLQEVAIEYIHIPKLGGRRKSHKDSLNTRWNNPSFRAYADYMETSDFTEGVHQLEHLAMTNTTAYMCSEAVWRRCHRSMIADYLKAKGRKVLHIIDHKQPQEHPYTQPAQIHGEDVSYRETA